jgi:hypothetical protein
MLPFGPLIGYSSERISAKQFGLSYKPGELLKDKVDLLHMELANRFIAQDSLGIVRLGAYTLNQNG